MASPLDIAGAIPQAWTGFRISFSAATALRILLSELSEAAPGYLETLQERLASAVIHGFNWQEEGDPLGEPFDGYVPLQGPGDTSVTFIPLEEAQLLEDQLFPAAATPTDYLWLVRGLVVVALHSALENWARAAGAKGSKLPEAVEQLLHPHTAHRLDAPTFAELAEFDATRHLFVHSGGIVDAAYITAVRHTSFLVNERRPLDDAALDRYSRLAWQVADAIRRVTPDHTTGAA